MKSDNEEIDDLDQEVGFLEFLIVLSLLIEAYCFHKVNVRLEVIEKKLFSKSHDLNDDISKITDAPPDPSIK